MRNQFYNRKAQRIVSLALVVSMLFSNLTSLAYATEVVDPDEGTNCSILFHKHTVEECFINEDSLICGIEEGEVHTHSEECFQQGQVQICDLEESEAHKHDDTCLEMRDQQVCELEENVPHTHDEECYESVQSLICEKTEHNHEESCYQVESIITNEDRTTSGKEDDVLGESTGIIDVSKYSSSLVIFNNMYCTNADGSGHLWTSDVFTLTGTPIKAIDLFIGDQGIPNMEPQNNNIVVALQGLNMPKTYISDVFLESASESKTILNVMEESVLSAVEVEAKAVVEINMSADLTIGSLNLYDGSAVTINTNGHVLTLTNTYGEGNLTINGNGTVTGESLSALDLVINGASVTMSSIKAHKLTLTNAVVDAQGGEITAQQSITASETKVSNAKLFGFETETEANDPVTMSFWDCSFENIATVGAEEGCLVTVDFADDCSIASETGTTYVQDYKITYYAGGGELTAQEGWLQSYRVKTTGFSSETGEILTENKTLPEYAVAGYSYTGWKLSPDAKEVIIELSNQRGDLKLYLQQEAGSVNVTMDLGFVPNKDNCDNDEDNWIGKYNTDTGNGTSSYVSVQKLDQTIPLDVPNRFGYVFGGWKITGCERIIEGSSYTIKLDELTSQEEYALKLEAIWTVDAFPLYWTLTGIPLDNIDISLDGKEWTTPEDLVKKYPELWTWDASAQTLRTLKDAYINYGESLDTYFERLNPEWNCMILRDTRSGDVQQAFRTWALQELSVSENSTFDVKESTGLLLHGKNDQQSWTAYQTDLKGKPITLTSSFGTAEYNLNVTATTGWTYWVNGVQKKPNNGVIAVPNGAKVTFSMATNKRDTYRISYWTVAAQNGSYIEPTERPYKNGDGTLYYDFVMPASDVTARYQTKVTNYIDLFKGSITFVKGYTYNGLQRDGFWSQAPVIAGATDTYKLPLAGMTPLFKDAEKGYFYLWNFSHEFNVTTDGVPTTNQLTLCNTLNLRFKEVNLSARAEYLENANERKVYGFSVELPRDTTAGGNQGTVATNVNGAGKLSELGNIVLANSGSAKQTFKLTFEGTSNRVASIFSDQYYYGNNNSLTITGIDSTSSALKLGTIFTNASMTVSNITVNEYEDTNSIYLLHAVSASGTISFSNAVVNAPNKEVYTKDSSFSLSSSAKADIGVLVSGVSMSIAANCNLRVRGDIYVGYSGMSLGENATVVIDGSYLTNYFHWSSEPTMGAPSAVLIVKGNRCELGNALWTNGTMICNALVMGRRGGITGGTVIANQIMNAPSTHWNVPENSTEYVFTKTSQIEAVSKNDDTLPFLTYSQATSASAEYTFSGGKIYLLGYYKTNSSQYDTSVKVADTPVQELLAPMLDAEGNYNNTAVSAAEALKAVKESTLTGNECVVLGNSTYETEARNRTIVISGNVELYAAGNMTFFNTTKVSGGTVWCGGTFGSKNDITISGGSITADEIGVAYDLTAALEDNTTRWKKVEITGGSVTADRIGTLSMGVSSSSHPIRGTLVADLSKVNAKTLVFDEYINYLMSSAGFINPEANQQSGTVRITGTISNGTVTYSTDKEVSFAAPTFNGNEEVWKLNSSSGMVVTGIDTSATLITSESVQLPVKAYDSDRIILFATKNNYTAKIAQGTEYVNDLNAKGVIYETTADAGNIVTLTLNDADIARNKTVVWYTDAMGYVHNPGYKAEGNTVTFTMPYNDVEIVIAPDGLDLDLSKYDITICEDGFRTHLDTLAEGIVDDREFHYTGSLNIKQSSTAQTTKRIRVLNDVNNVDSSRIFNLIDINQKDTAGDIGLKLEDGAKAAFTVTGTVGINRVEVPESSAIIMKGTDSSRANNKLHIRTSTSVQNTNTVALGNANGKCGDITLENVQLQPTSKQFEIFGYSYEKTPNKSNTISYINCEMDIEDWYSSSYLACYSGTVIIRGCDFRMKGATTWPSPLFSNVQKVEVYDTTLNYYEIGATSGDATSWLHGVKQEVIVTDSKINVILRNSANASKPNRYKSTASGIAPLLTLKGDTVYTTEERITLNKLVLEGKSILNVGASAQGYLFAEEIEVMGNAQLNADTVLVSGYLKDQFETRAAVETALAGTNPALLDGKNGGLILNGGTVTANSVGGDVNGVITVNAGTLNAKKIGTLGQIYGYERNIPTSGEKWVATLAKVSVGAIVNINGGTVNVGEYLGGMNAQVNVSGGSVLLDEGAILGMTDAQADTLKNHYSSNQGNIQDHKNKNIIVQISGGKVEGDKGTINTPYGSATINGTKTGVKVENILAHYGAITINESAGVYDNKLSGLEKVGVYVVGTLKGQSIDIGNQARVFAENAIANAELSTDTASMNIGMSGFAILYTGKYGSEGQGIVEIKSVEGAITTVSQQYTISYVMHDDEIDRARNHEDNAQVFIFDMENKTPVKLHDPQRDGYEFMGWYETAEDAENLTNKLEVVNTFMSKNIQLHAAWKPKEVEFQIQIEGSKVEDIQKEYTDLLTMMPNNASLEDNVLTFTDTVKIPYRAAMFGNGEQQINLNNFSLPSYSINVLRVEEDGMKQQLDASTATVSREILNLYEEQKKTDSDAVITLRAVIVVKKNEKLTLDLNLNESNRPMGASFQESTAEQKTATTISSYAAVGSTVKEAAGFVIDGKLNQPTAPGYTFGGWYTDAECTDANGPIGSDYKVGGENAKYFYAKWIPNEQVILFDAGEGAVITKTADEPSGETTSRTLNAYVIYDAKLDGNIAYKNESTVTESQQMLPSAWKQGYIFKGWSEDGKTIVDDQELNTSTFSTMDLNSHDVVLTLTAVYRPVGITYHLEGGTFTDEWNEKIADVKVKYGEPLAGYSIKPTDDDSCDVFGDQTVGGNTYAVVSTTAVHYAANNQYVENDYRHEIIRKGYTFGGWKDKDGQLVGTVPEYSDIELWAVWTANTYILTLKTGIEEDSILHESAVYPENQTVQVVVDQEIANNGIAGVNVDKWPNREDWYAISPDKHEEKDKRYLLGFTFDPLEPGAPDTNETAQMHYRVYASAVTTLLNNNALFNKRETLIDGGTNEGSIFHLPAASEYSENKISGTHEIPDYPNGSNINMYAIYRERSLVFIERYIDTESGQTMETVMYSAPYYTYNDYPDQYELTDNKKVVEKKGYTLTRWAVNHPTNGESYPTVGTLEARQAEYNSKLNSWVQKAKEMGSYDVNVYTVYAAQVTVDQNSKNPIVLTASSSPVAENGTVRNWTIPSSMTVEKMNYDIKGLSNGLRLVSIDDLKANRYDSEHTNDVAIKMDLINSSGSIEETLWLTEGAGGSELGIGAGWTIRLTLYHSCVITETKDLAFTMTMTFANVPNQQITFAPVTVKLQPTLWTVEYSAILPNDPYLNVVASNGFSTSGAVRTANDTVWVYGSVLKAEADIPVLEGYAGKEQWKYLDSENYNYGTNAAMSLTEDNNGIIRLSTEYAPREYQLTAEEAVTKGWTISKTGEVNYHEAIAFTAKDKQTAAYIWLVYNGASYRLDRLIEEDYAPDFHAKVENGVYTILMPAEDVNVVYNDVLDLYLDNGTIDITKADYTQNGKTVAWPGHYRILQNAENDATTTTPNVLNLSGDLSKRSIRLGNLNISSDDSISAAAASVVNLTAEGGITAKNILVPVTAVLALSGGNQKIELSPAKDRAAIGGHNAACGTIAVQNLNLTLNMPAGSYASAIGSGNFSAGGTGVTVTNCSIFVNEEGNLSDGVYKGTWFGGKNVESVLLSGSNANIGTTQGGHIIDGKQTTIINCEVGSVDARIKYHGIRGGNISICNSSIYLETSKETLLCPENILVVDKDLQESSHGTIIDITGYAEKLYTGVLQICHPKADVTVSGFQLIELKNGDIVIQEINSEGTGAQLTVTQGTATHIHSGTYRLISEFGSEYDGETNLTVGSLSNGVWIQATANCQLDFINVNGQTNLTPYGELQVFEVQISKDVALTVDAKEGTGLDVTTIGGEGNYVQNSGTLTATGNLVVGGDMTLDGVVVTTAGNVGSDGTSGVSTVTIRDGSVSAANIGACGAPNTSFTFVELEGTPTLNGNLIRDQYRLTYVLDNPSFKVDEISKVPYSTQNQNEMLPTVLRSTCPYTAESGAGTVTYSPIVPDAPYYKLSEDQTQSCFSNWYVIHMNDSKEERLALSEETVTIPGFDRNTTLTDDHLEDAEVTVSNDGTKTLTVYSWMKISGSGVIAYGRELNALTTGESSVNIESDGSWTARFDVEGTILSNSKYEFRFDQALPANVKLTLSFRDKDQQPIYYYYISKGGETELSEEKFKRMGTETGADLFNDKDENASQLFEHTLQLSADYSDASASAGTVTLVGNLAGVKQDIAAVSYTATLDLATASVSATASKVSVVVEQNDDTRLLGTNLYLVATLTNGSDAVSVPYTAELTLGDIKGTWLGGNMAYFDLGAYKSLSEEKTWTLSEVDAGEYEVTWTLTAAEAGIQNVFDQILATSESVTFSAEKATDPKLEVALASAHGSVLSAEAERTLLFTYETTASVVTVIVEKQTSLGLYNTVSSATAAVAGTSVTIPSEAGVYRVRFSMSESDWDDVYFGFIVK